MADRDTAKASPTATRRHEVDVERRRAHPGEPRRTTPVDRPSPREDRRGAHAWAAPTRGR